MQPVMYRLSLFNTKWSDEFLNYEYAVLPLSGDIIEVSNECLFEVRSRIFKHQKGKLVPVVLQGEILNNADNEQHNWDELKYQIANYRKDMRFTQKINFEQREFTPFPDTLD